MDNADDYPCCSLGIQEESGNLGCPKEKGARLLLFCQKIAECLNLHKKKQFWANVEEKLLNNTIYGRNICLNTTKREGNRLQVGYSKEIHLVKGDIISRFEV